MVNTKFQHGLFVALLTAGAVSQPFAQNLPPAPVASPTSASAPLTMQQAIDIALSKNPTLLAARQNLHSVKAQETQAGLRVNPYFGFTGSNITLPAQGASNPYAYSLQLSRLFDRGN